jgi:acyl-CoA synthetase (AMP-forming)/AMP-acid ligase II
VVNLHAPVAFHALRQPDKTALIYAEEAVSYAEFNRRIQRMAALIASRGIGDGDVVALFMKNSAAFLDIAFAISYLGAVFLPINFRLVCDEARHIIDDSKARLVFVDEEFPQVAALHANTLVVDTLAQRDSTHLSHDTAPVPPPCQRRPQDLFRLMYTSGTTSRPKGVMHSYENFYWKSLDHDLALGLTAENRLLVVGPLYHVGAFDLPGIAVLLHGGMLCIQRDFDAEGALSSIDRHALNCAWAAPIMMNRMLAVENPRRFNLSSLQWCIGGGEKTPESRIREFGSVFSNGRYIDGYGLTETCSGDTLMEAGWEIEKIGSTGRALPHVEVTILDEDGRCCGSEVEGEICLRGPKVTQGYWNAPEKTAESFFGDWFRTGDVGRLDAEGFLYVTDRRKDMILTGAENVASSEIENVIYQLPEVGEAAVVGVPDPSWGERVVAVIVPKARCTLDLPTLQTHCRSHLAGFKVPAELEIREALPRNPSGKILKRVLRDEISG